MSGNSERRSRATHEKLGARCLLGIAIAHDAESAKVFSTLLRYQAQVSRELKRAKEEYETLVCFLANAKTKPKPIATPEPEPPRAEPPQPAAKEEEPAALTPRNALCPCGSGVKFKRCCGENSPAVLGAGAVV